ncbi:hypothetical protein H9P43_006343 [Blastocladiella emersonii ATCC 22665]|nr:hypothetical protein H9P43_006343 [Blastocladiella emersonii ATCC 22665]
MAPRASVALLALAAVLLVVARQAHAAQFKIAVTLPIANAPMGTVAQSAKDVLDASVNDINQWAASAGTNHTFQLIHYDSENILSKGVKSVFSAAQSGAVGLIGDYSSSVSIPMSLSAQQFNLWQCVGAATSPELSNKTNHPYFFRTIPPDVAQSVFLARFVKAMGWNSVAVLFASDAYGTGIMTNFMNKANELEIRVNTAQSFTPGDDHEGYALSLDAIVTAGTRIVLYLGTFPDFIPIARLAREKGLIGNDWVWLASEGTNGVVDELKKPQYSAKDREVVNGLLFAFPAERTPGSEPFLNAYRSQFPQRQVLPYSLYYRDCFMSLARGIIKAVAAVGESAVLARNYPATFSLAQFLVPYNGVTGAVGFDANGDRVSDYAIMNVYGMETKTAYLLPVNGSGLIKRDPPTFFAGTSDVPKDVPTMLQGYITYKSAGGIAILLLLGSIAAVIVATMAYLFTKRQSSAVKNMSLPFLSLISAGLLMVLGAEALWLDVPTAMTCNLQSWILLVGMELVLSAVAAKAYRIWKIFDNKALTKLVQLSNTRLFMSCLLIVVVQSAILVVWTLLSPLQPMLVSSLTSNSYECRSANTTVETAFKTISIAYNAVLLIVLAVLAYKTRKVYSAFRESVFIAYAVQNVFLCGVVVTPFLYLSKQNFALASTYIKLFTVTYAVCFSFACLVGRIAMALVLASKSNVGIKMSMEGGSSNDGTSSAEHVPGKASTMSQKCPVKIANRLFETWHTQRITLFALEGFLGLTRLTNNTEQGKLFKLRAVQFDPTPSNYPLCIELRADNVSYLVQFSKDEDKAKWVRALSVHCLVHSKSSATRSSGNGRNGGATTAANGTSTFQAGGMSYTLSTHYGNGGAGGARSQTGQWHSMHDVGGGKQ